MRTWLIWFVFLLILVISVIADVTYQLSICYGNDCRHTTQTCTDGNWCEIDKITKYLATECMTPSMPGALQAIDIWNLKLDYLRDGTQDTAKRDLTEQEYLDFLLADTGRIYTMCDDVNAVTNGTKFFKCGTGNFYSYGKTIAGTQIQDFSQTTIKGHEFVCKNSTIYECGAGNATVAGNNFMPAECCTEGTKNFYNSPRTGIACWNKQPVIPGGTPAAGIMNINGRFMGCKLSPAQLTQTDGYTNTPLITNHAECSTIYADAFGPELNGVCGPTGEWMPTTEPPGTNTTTKQIKWQAPSVNSTTGCCPADKCWNGNACQAKGTYYTIGETAYFCE